MNSLDRYLPRFTIAMCIAALALSAFVLVVEPLWAFIARAIERMN